MLDLLSSLVFHVQSWGFGACAGHGSRAQCLPKREGAGEVLCALLCLQGWGDNLGTLLCLCFLPAGSLQMERGTKMWSARVSERGADTAVQERPPVTAKV